MLGTMIDWKYNNTEDVRISWDAEAPKAQAYCRVLKSCMGAEDALWGRSTTSGKVIQACNERHNMTILLIKLLTD